MITYLDNASTTRPWDEVFMAMKPFILNSIGNPYSSHAAGKEAREAVETARVHVANLIHASPDQIIFTSGATESNNIILASADKCNNIVSTSQEHDSVYSRAVFGNIVPPKCGRVDIDGLKRAANCSEMLYSIMFTNNETGIDNDIKRICREINGLGVLHTDATQAIMSHNINVNEIGCDYMTFSSHKMHGPKGVGCIFAKDLSVLKRNAILKGGDYQEQGIRGGTLPVHDIVGFGEACRILYYENLANPGKIQSTLFKLKDVFVNTLIDLVGGDRAKVNFEGGCSGILSVSIDGVDAETLVMASELFELAISSGSACHSSKIEPSRSLMFAGLTEEQANSTVRISFGLNSTEQDSINGAKKLYNSILFIDKMSKEL